MEIVEKLLSELTPYENNPRINEKAVDSVAESIRQYGFKVPMVVDRGGVIVTGHTRYKAAQKLGLEKVPCIVSDDLTEEQIRAFRIADNKVSDIAIWDNKKLLEELSEIDMDMFTGFDVSDYFDDTVDESDNAPVVENENGVVYEVTFKSETKAKIDKILKLWEGLDAENSGS